MDERCFFNFDEAQPWRLCFFFEVGWEKGVDKTNINAHLSTPLCPIAQLSPFRLHQKHQHRHNLIPLPRGCFFDDFLGFPQKPIASTTTTNLRN
jgi:hypothetical protein